MPRTAKPKSSHLASIIDGLKKLTADLEAYSPEVAAAFQDSYQLKTLKPVLSNIANVIRDEEPGQDQGQGQVQTQGHGQDQNQGQDQNADQQPAARKQRKTRKDRTNGNNEKSECAGQENEGREGTTGESQPPDNNQDPA